MRLLSAAVAARNQESRWDSDMDVLAALAAVCYLCEAASDADLEILG